MEYHKSLVTFSLLLLLLSTSPPVVHHAAEQNGLYGSNISITCAHFFTWASCFSWASFLWASANLSSCSSCSCWSCFFTKSRLILSISSWHWSLASIPSKAQPSILDILFWLPWKNPSIIITYWRACMNFFRAPNMFHLVWGVFDHHEHVYWGYKKLEIQKTKFGACGCQSNYIRHM